MVFSGGVTARIGIVLLLISNVCLAQQAVPHCAFPAPVRGGPINPHTRFVETQLLPTVIDAGTKPFSLENRMRTYGVPGVSVAVVHDGKLDWARAWGVRDTNSCLPVTPMTAFQAASISKFVTALAALRLVEQGKLSLDADINNYLTSWKLARDETLAPQPITLRDLLTHTAGLNIHGFPGYAAGSPLPTAVQVLNGEAPANTEAVKSILTKGEQWRYSGGGYLIVQVALSDVTGQPFDRLVEKQVFRPLGLHRSAFTQPPSPSVLSDAASAHDYGKPIAGGYRVYPELGPAGLWTTPTELALMFMDIQASANKRSSKLLSPAMTAQMLTPAKGDWGLGPALYGEGTNRRFSHGGANEGFESTMIAYVHKGEGVVVMTNGRGRGLAEEIVRAVAKDYAWQDLMVKPVVDIRVLPDRLVTMVGRYEGGGKTVYLNFKDAHLFAQTGDPNPQRLFALTPERFQSEGSGIVIEFQKDQDGRPPGFKIVEGGPPISFVRTESLLDPFVAPIYLRGSMNDWNTTAPLTKLANGNFVVDMLLAAGEYQFKFGSDDWRPANLGASGSAPLSDTVNALPLIQGGSNIHVNVGFPGNYRFKLQRDRNTIMFTLKRKYPGG